MYFLLCLTGLMLMALFATSVSWSSPGNGAGVSIKESGSEKTTNAFKHSRLTAFWPKSEVIGDSDPTLVTDKDSYVAGETIVFTGEHWAPGEAVTIIISRGEGGEQTTLQATADDKGSFTVNSIMPEVRTEEKELKLLVKREGGDVVFTARATGSTSGETAETEYSGGDPTTDGERLIDQETYWFHRLSYPTLTPTGSGKPQVRMPGSNAAYPRVVNSRVVR